LPTGELRQFLDALWPDLTGRWLLFWSAPGKRSEWVQAITEDTVTLLENWASKENVYVGCALRGNSLGATLRGERSECQAIPGLWLDIDCGAEHKKPNLPPDEAGAMELVKAMGLPPSAIVHSGRGLQAWWLFREPWVFDTEEERTAAETLTKGWCNTLRAKAKERGWDADQVGDLPRVMRLPGLWNRKGVPKRTKLLSLTEARYNPDEFAAYLVQGSEKTEKLPDIKWDIQEPPNAEPPAEKFLLLCDIDSQFKLAWSHGRTEIQDQSCSSYDMALATRAFAASWTAQEVVNLLIAHRRKYKADLKIGRGYYARTLTVAMSGKGVEERRQMIQDLKAGHGLPESVSKDPAEVLSLLSSMLGVTITKIVRYRAEMNQYEIEVGGKLIAIPSIDLIASQPKFRNLILDRTDHLLQRQPPKTWDDIIRKLFETIENVDSSPLATSKGSLEGWIELYLQDGLWSDESTWEQAAEQYRPFLLKGHTYLSCEGLRQFIFGRQQERVSTQSLAVQLTKLGYQYERKMVRTKRGGKTCRGLWRNS